MYYSQGLIKETQGVDFESLGLRAIVLDASEIDEVLAYEQTRAANRGDAPMLSWHAPWRSESLQFYIPKGWSFALRDSANHLRAYFLAQPLLFYGGMTQTLWVEYLCYDDRDALSALVDLARRYARDKHLQKVIFNLPSNVDLSSMGAHRTSANTFEFNTTRMV